MRIFKHYEFSSQLYCSHDIVNNSDKFADKYTSEEKESFITYLNNQVDKIDLENKDEAFETKITEMYANTLINHLSVKQD